MSRQIKLKLMLLLVVVGVIGLVLWQKNRVRDWLALFNYHPSNSITQLANQTTMTELSRHIFLINHPQLEDKVTFNVNCPNNGGEQTDILGCYHPTEAGIFLYAVNDPKLEGVEQVTAAHEMLHGAYDRLSAKDRIYVNGLLEQYYQHDLHDQKILQVIDLYKQTEPNSIVNEMHSIFGTEIANLSPALEQYYARYFTKRSVIVSYYQQYNDTFNNYHQIIVQDDQTLTSLRDEINANEATLANEQNALASQKSQLNGQLANGNSTAYNQGVITYDSRVDMFDNQLSATKQLINQYNQLVTQRNAIATEENQLTQEINSNLSPLPQQ